MPPFITRECPYCERENTYDLAALKKDPITVYRKIEIVQQSREYIVSCDYCKKEFVITVDAVS